jgi:23S rRNA (guanosine2251-2'-O)-methyltransferase
LIVGRNPVHEVFRAARRSVRRLYLAEGITVRGPVAAIVECARSSGTSILSLQRRDLNRVSDAHQGVAAVADPYPYGGLLEVMDRATVQREPPFLLLLDVIQNPQNLGTLLRTAEAAGVHGVILPARRGVEVTTSVMSASAGACEHLLIVRKNLAAAIAELKEAGIWIAGLEAGAEAVPIEQVDMRGSVALVVGSEGEGMRDLVRKSCDYLVRLPMRGRVGSLNAAVAGSLAVYTVWKARGYPGAGSSFSLPGALKDS